MDLMEPHFYKDHRLTYDNFFTSPAFVYHRLDKGTHSTVVLERFPPTVLSFSLENLLYSILPPTMFLFSPIIMFLPYIFGSGFIKIVNGNPIKIKINVCTP